MQDVSINSQPETTARHLEGDLMNHQHDPPRRPRKTPEDITENLTPDARWDIQAVEVPALRDRNSPPGLFARLKQWIPLIR